MIYLASPYSHPDPVIRKTRFLLVEQCAANLIKAGRFVWTPIVYTHEMAIKHSFPTDAEFWKKLNISFLRKADEMYLLKIDGWMESKGVMMELKLAEDMLIPIRFVNPEGEFIS